MIFVELRERNDSEVLVHVPEKSGCLQLAPEEERAVRLIEVLVVGVAGVGGGGKVNAGFPEEG